MTTGHAAPNATMHPAPVRIVAITGAHGAVVVQTPPDQQWLLRTTVAMWRGPDGALHEHALTLDMRVTEAAGKDLQTRISPDTVVAMTVAFAGADLAACPVAQLVSFLGPAADAELSQALARLTAVVTVEDPYFGHLALNRRVAGFEGKATWMGAGMKVILDGADPGTLPIRRATAQALWSEAKEWLGKVGKRATDDLLALKNDAWLEEGERKLSPASFIRQLGPVSAIVIGDDGAFTFRFDDSKLFWGHSLSVAGTLTAGALHAKI